MELKVLERVLLFHALPDPKEGKFLTYKTLRVLREALVIDEEDSRRINFRVNIEQGGYDWDAEIEPPKSFDFTERETSVIRDALTQLDEREAVTKQHYSLYEKFFPEAE